jgi:hypothetical protein
MSSAAVAFYIETADGAAVATRPGYVISPKSDGYVDVMMRGIETDWDGAGKERDPLYVIPMIYYAQAPDRTPAVNLLTNPSFDTYTGGTGVADGWTQSGTLGTMVFDVGEDDPAPPTIFGKRQRVFESIGGTSNAFITQAPSFSLVPGDSLSGGVWVRVHANAGASMAGTEHYLRVNGGRPEVATTFFPTVASDWAFVRATSKLANSYGTAPLNLVSFDAKGYEVRYDDAFLFKGTWASFAGEVFRLPVRARSRPSKTNFVTENFIAGRGGFEVDTNADGVADGWSKTGATNTYAIERDPDHLNLGISPTGTGAEKVTLNAATTDRLRLLLRGHFKAGETWRFQVYYKNSGALSGSPANGDFGIVLHTEQFDGVYEESSLAGANFATTSIATYASKFRTLALTADHSVLVCDINLKTATGGTLWLDDALLWRTA